MFWGPPGVGKLLLVSLLQDQWEENLSVCLLVELGTKQKLEASKDLYWGSTWKSYSKYKESRNQ